MKKTFDIIKLSESQSVLVDRTRIPKDGENYWDDKLKVHKIRGLTPDWYRVGEDLPIIASREETPGVLLIPGEVWEKSKSSGYDNAELVFLRTKNFGAKQWDTATMSFKAGYEAAGGYTRHDILSFPLWLHENRWEHYLTNPVSGIQYKRGGDAQFELQHLEELLNVFMTERNTPRQLIIDVLPDGTMPRETIQGKEYIIVKQVIY